MSAQKAVSLMMIVAEALAARFAHRWKEAVKKADELEAASRQNPAEREKFALAILALKAECGRPILAKKMAKKLSRQLSRMEKDKQSKRVSANPVMSIMSEDEQRAKENWENFWKAYSYLVLACVFRKGKQLMSPRHLEKSASFAGKVRIFSATEIKVFQEFYGYFAGILVAIFLHRGVSVYQKKKKLWEEAPGNEEYLESLRLAGIAKAGASIVTALTFCNIHTSHLLNTASWVGNLKEIEERLTEYLFLAMQSGHPFHVIAALMGIAQLRKLGGAKDDDELIGHLLANVRLFLPLIPEEEERSTLAVAIRDFPSFLERIRRIV